MTYYEFLLAVRKQYMINGSYLCPTINSVADTLGDCEHHATKLIATIKTRMKKLSGKANIDVRFATLSEWLDYPSHGGEGQANRLRYLNTIIAANTPKKVNK